MRQCRHVVIPQARLIGLVQGTGEAVDCSVLAALPIIDRCRVQNAARISVDPSAHVTGKGAVSLLGTCFSGECTAAVRVDKIWN